MRKLSCQQFCKVLPMTLGLLWLVPISAIARPLPRIMTQDLAESSRSNVTRERSPNVSTADSGVRSAAQNGVDTGVLSIAQNQVSVQDEVDSQSEAGAQDASLPTLPTPDSESAMPAAEATIQPPAPQPAAPFPSAFAPLVPGEYAAANYLLGPGDRIEVSVYGFEEYTGPLSVLPDGMVTLPLIGKVPAVGRTTEQLAEELTVALDRILVRPSVSVTLNSLRPVVINVSGEVYRPGPVQLQDMTSVASEAGTGAAPPSVSEALVQAGGVTRTADIRDVVVMRALPNGETVRTKVNLWDALWSETLPEDLLLRDGDLVFVPTLSPGETLDARLLARSSLAPETVRVRVVGEVTRPGEVNVPPNASLSSAVAIAGGPTDDAKLNEVAFIRMNESGDVAQEVVDLSNLVDNYQVQDGDVVVIGKTGTGSVLDFAQRLLGPLGFLLRIF